MMKNKMTDFFPPAPPNLDDARFRSVSTNESLKRREKRLGSIMAAAALLIFSAMVLFHLIVAVAVLFY